MFGTRVHRILYITFLSGIAFSLPTSIFLTSVFSIALVSNWILDFTNYRNAATLIRNRSLLAFLLIYALYLLFMLNTSNLDSGLHVLRLKLPLLGIPLVIATSVYISNDEKRIILSSFIIGVLIASVAGTIYYFGIADDMNDRRDISLFISHIRLALMVCLAFSISAYYTLVHDDFDFRLKYVYALSSIWFFSFILILMSFTGIIIFIIIILFSAFWITRKARYTAYARITGIVSAIVFALLLSYIAYMLHNYYSIEDREYPDMTELTESGRRYSHFNDRKYIENGHYVWRYICEPELRQEWNRRSTLDYDGVDLRDQELRYTLIRYMTSLGLRKDSTGISKLTDEDIDIIEAGYANSRYKDGKSIGDRVYELIWQVDYYFKGGNPQGHSLTQRIEFFKTGVDIFRRYPVFGTGTGDLVDEFGKQYEINRSDLEESHRFISHNQYLTILISFGIPGFLIFIFAFLYPVMQRRGFKDYLLSVFLIIATLSMLNEDTLETHTGVTFVSFFYALFLFGFANYGDYYESDNKVG